MNLSFTYPSSSSTWVQRSGALTRQPQKHGTHWFFSNHPNRLHAHPNQTYPTIGGWPIPNQDAASLGERVAPECWDSRDHVPGCMLLPKIGNRIRRVTS